MGLRDSGVSQGLNKEEGIRRFAGESRKRGNPLGWFSGVSGVWSWRLAERSLSGVVSSILLSSNLLDVLKSKQ